MLLENIVVPFSTDFARKKSFGTVGNTKDQYLH